MDVRQLKYFLAVADCGGFSKAAAQLKIAQPSLSQTIARLERELGMPLFHRVGRGVVLSDAGKALVGPARVALRDIDEAIAAMRELKGLRGGRLDLITMASPGVEPLTTILSTFTCDHPDVTINTTTGFTPEDILDSVRSGACEIGVLGSAQPFSAPDLAVIELESQALVLISGPDDHGPAGPTVRREALSGCRMIVFQHGSPMRALVDDILAEGIQVAIAAEVADRTFILPMVLNGIGRAIILLSWTESARRASVRVQRIVPESYLHVVAVSRRTHLTAPAAALMAQARRYSGQPPSR